MSKVNVLYVFVVCTRILLVFTPQKGYIHPDEFFQSVEIAAGDAFELEITKPWEFNVTFPVRSSSSLYLTAGIGLRILKLLDYVSRGLMNVSIVDSYTLLIFPRLLMCLLSYLIDFSLYRVCKANDERCDSKLHVLATSYVILIYGTRTFSNTIELVLVSLLLYYVAESIVFSAEVLGKLDYINTCYEKADTPSDRAKLHKLRRALAPHTFKSCFAIATITSLGFFNRPTFALYAIGPVFIWFYRGAGFKSFPLAAIHWRMLLFLVSALPTVCLLIVIDSFYYGYLSWGEIGLGAISLDNFVVTPFNFVKYNIDSKNLATHGEHPLYTHVLLNVPLLFNVLGFAIILYLLDFIQKLAKGKFHRLPRIDSIEGLMSVTFLIPIIGLSLFQHQEPRFLVPLLIPVVYLTASTILPERDDVTTIRERNRNDAYAKKKKMTTTTTRGKYPNTLLHVWYFLNVSCVILFGFVHQAGIVPLAKHMSLEFAANPNVCYRIVTSHTYMIPKSLFLLTKSKNRSHQRCTIVEEGSARLEDVLRRIRERKPVDDCKNYLAIPAMLERELYRSSTKFGIAERARFFPHLSTEGFQSSKHHDPLDPFFHDNFTSGCCSLKQMLAPFSLNLYEITLL